MTRNDRYCSVLFLGLGLFVIGQDARAEDSLLQQQVNAALSLMTFTVTPDVTASNLSINNGGGDTSDLLLTQLGGGATMSDGFPIYLEGNLGFSRYDPQFVITRGEETNTFPAKWNTLSASGGMGRERQMLKISVSICVAAPPRAWSSYLGHCVMFWRGPAPNTSAHSGGCWDPMPSTRSVRVWRSTAASMTSSSLAPA